VTPFTLRSGAQFRLDPPEFFDLTSEEYAADYNEVKSIGEVLSSSGTAEQSQIAASLHSDPRWQELRRRMNLPVE
jgi:hypothetical protein